MKNNLTETENLIDEVANKLSFPKENLSVLKSMCFLQQPTENITKEYVERILKIALDYDLQDKLEIYGFSIREFVESKAKYRGSIESGILKAVELGYTDAQLGHFVRSIISTTLRK